MKTHRHALFAALPLLWTSSCAAPDQEPDRDVTRAGSTGTVPPVSPVRPAPTASPVQGPADTLAPAVRPLPPLDALLFDLAPEAASRFALAQAAVTSAADNAGGGTVLAAQGTAPERTMDSGHWAVKLVDGTSALASATGGVGGNAPHTLVGVMRFPENPLGYDVLAFGSPGAASGVGMWVTTYSYGGSGFAAISSRSVDTKIHLVEKSQDGVGSTLRVDGQLVEGPYPHVYALSGGLGLFGHDNAMQSAPGALLYRGLWLGEAWPAGSATRWTVERYMLQEYPELQQPRELQIDGDSLAAGAGASDPAHRLGAQLQTLLGAAWTVKDRAIGGSKIIPDVQIRAGAVLGDLTPLSPSNTVILWCGSNDLGAAAGHQPAAPTYAALLAEGAALRAGHARVIVLTSVRRFDTFTTPQQAEADAFNARITGAGYPGIVSDGGADAVLDVAADPDLQDPTKPPFVDGYHLDDAKQLQIAQRLAPMME